jgi:hypothetical protein
MYFESRVISTAVSLTQLFEIGYDSSAACEHAKALFDFDVSVIKSGVVIFMTKRISKRISK